MMLFRKSCLLGGAAIMIAERRRRQRQRPGQGNLERIPLQHGNSFRATSPFIRARIRHRFGASWEVADLFAG
jgi:hypothetical protein